VEVAKALGGSFKLVTLTPKTVREMTQLPGETQKDGGLVIVTLMTFDEQSTASGRLAVES